MIRLAKESLAFLAVTAFVVMMCNISKIAGYYAYMANGS
jgi:hypothetical protein